MTPRVLFWSSLLALLAVTIAKVAVRALRDFSRHDLEDICRRRGKPEMFTDILQEHEQVGLGIDMLATLAMGVALALSVAWMGANWKLAIMENWQPILFSGLVAGLVLAICTVWVSRAVARVFAEEFLYHTWPAWRGMAFIARPLSSGANLIDVAMHRLGGRQLHGDEDERIEEEIRAIVSEGHREGLLEEEAREMIEGVIDLGDADVAEIMTPRTDLNMLSIHLEWESLIAAAIDTGHTRIPIYDKNRDDIVGILYTKDLLPELATGDADSRTPIRDLLRKPVFVPETKPVNDLLQMLQKMRTHIAVVLDEYGGVSGIVTIEDVLEEIVGEIVDEYDEEVADEVRKIDDDTCEAPGRTHIDEINELLNIELPEDGDFDTIGGFVFSELGRVPLVGESLVWQERVEIQVLEASKRRIEKVRIGRVQDDQRESA